MHILFVTTELATDKNASGGLASFIANMARIFVNKGHKVSIILSTLKETELLFDKDITVINSYIPLKVWSVLDFIAAILTFFNKKNRTEVRQFLMRFYSSKSINNKIRRINKREKIDIVHFTNLASVALFANKEIPYIIRLSSISNLWRSAEEVVGKAEYKFTSLSLQERLEEYVIRKSKYIVSPSNYLADITRKYINPNVKVIESPFLLNCEGWDYDIYNRHIKDKKYILHYGRLGYVKGTHIICQIAEEILEKNPNMYIVIAGKNSEMIDENGNVKTMEMKLKESAGKHADRVIYLGRLVREQLYPVIQNAEVCVLPSRVENLANACIEAMAMGKIVVATNGVSFEQLIEDRVTGFLCETENADSFLEGITNALNLSEDDKLEMGTRAKRSVERMSPEKIYEKYFEYYQGVIGNYPTS